MSLSLTGQTDKGLWFGGINVAKLLNLLSLAHRNVRKFFSAAKNTYPTSAAGCGAAFYRNRPFTESRIDFAPVLRAVVRRAPGEILNIVHAVLGSLIVFVVSDGPLLVDCLQETKQTLAVVFRTLAQN